MYPFLILPLFFWGTVDRRGYKAISPNSGPSERRGDVAIWKFTPPFFLGLQRTQGICGSSDHIWAPENGGLIWPFLMFFPYPRTPYNGGVAHRFRPILVLREGKGYVPTGALTKMEHLCSTSAHFCATAKVGIPFPLSHFVAFFGNAQDRKGDVNDLP